MDTNKSFNATWTLAALVILATLVTLAKPATVVTDVSQFSFSLSVVVLKEHVCLIV